MEIETVRYYDHNEPVGEDDELKFHDVVLSSPGISSTGTITSASLVLIAQGTSESERIGRRITIRQINLRYSTSKNGVATSATTSDTARVIIYVDKQCNGATAIVTDVLEDTTFQSFYNLSNSSRFRFLVDKTYDLNCSSGGGTTVFSFGENVVNDTYSIVCRIPIEYTGTTTAITEIRSNNVGIITISENATSAFNGVARIRFSDE